MAFYWGNTHILYKQFNWNIGSYNTKLIDTLPYKNLTTIIVELNYRTSINEYIPCIISILNQTNINYTLVINTYNITNYNDSYNIDNRTNNYVFEVLTKVDTKTNKYKYDYLFEHSDMSEKMLFELGQSKITCKQLSSNVKLTDNMDELMQKLKINYSKINKALLNHNMQIIRRFIGFYTN